MMKTPTTHREWPSFDELKKTAAENPEALERFRQQEIDALIESAPVELRRRLRGIQFQIDCKRRLHKSPLGSCISISQMMHQSVNLLSEALSGRSIENHQEEKGQILTFPATC